MFKNSKYENTYIDLISLRATEMLQKQNFNITLKDDVWDHDTLLVKRGGRLNEALINKLINFGIKKVSINYSQPGEEATMASATKEFSNTQSALIIDNNLHNAGFIVRNLLDARISKSNIFLTDNVNSTNKFFRSRQINFLFINSSLYEKCQKCIDKYSLLRNTHAFVIMEENETARKLKGDYNSDVKFLIKPLYAKRLKFFINQSINQNFLDYYLEDSRAS